MPARAKITGISGDLIQPETDARLKNGSETPVQRLLHGRKDWHNTIQTTQAWPACIKVNMARNLLAVDMYIDLEESILGTSCTQDQTS